MYIVVPSVLTVTPVVSTTVEQPPFEQVVTAMTVDERDPFPLPDPLPFPLPPTLFDPFPPPLPPEPLLGPIVEEEGDDSPVNGQ